MELRRYIELKEKGIISLHKVGSKIVVVKEKWDPETGKNLSADILPVDIESINKQKDELQLQLNALNNFLADIEAINK